MSASTVLASRLSQPRDAHARVFALLLFSFAWFALAPALRKDLRVRTRRACRADSDQRAASLRSALTLTSILHILACALLAPISISACLALSLGSVLLSFGAPAVLVHAQRYKECVDILRAI